jgi:hypothetical protein
MEKERVEFIDPEVLAKEEAKTAEQALAEKMAIPNGYCEVKLDSLGKLSAPEILHFRNYSGEEAIELSVVKQNNYLEAIIKCLNRMVWEKFDCSLLNEKELEEVLMTIHLSFYGSVLNDYHYYKDLTLKGEKLEDSKNDGMTTIDIKSINTFPINEKFKEPIKITQPEGVVKFRLARLQDVLVAKEYIDKKYYTLQRKFSDIETKIQKKEEVSFEDNKAYEAFTMSRGKELINAVQSALIVEFEGKKLETLEEKMEIYPKIVQTYWQLLNSAIEKDCNFGLNPEVEFFSIELKKKITRRFLFQSVDFIPSLGVPTDSGDAVSFGD